MKRALAFPPLLVWLLIVLYSVDFVIVMMDRKTPSEELLTLAIFLTMLTLVSYIICYHISCGKFKQRENEKLNVFFLRGKKGRLHGIILSARCSLIFFFIAMLMMLVEANRGTGFIFVITCVFICITIVEYYFLHQREISEAHRARSWKLLVVCFSGSLFFANMFSSQFILEAFDIEPARLTFTRWSFSLIIMLCLISIVTYFVQLILTAFFPVVRRRRRQAMMAIYDSLAVTSLLFSASLFMLVITWWSPLANTLIGYFYHFDTRTTFSCQQRYHTIMPFGEDAGYIRVAEGEYRAIYKKRGIVDAATVKCLPDGGFTWHEIKYASEIHRQNIRPPDKQTTPDNTDPAPSNRE